MAGESTRTQFYSIFLDRLREIYSCEQQILESLPKLLKTISSSELRMVLESKLNRANKHQDELKKLFSELNQSPEGLFSEAMSGMLQECDYLKQKNLPDIVKDAALITTLQKILHYQIAGYGALKTFAKHLKMEDNQTTLEKILEDKSTADRELTKAAEGDYFTKGINVEAAE